MQTLHFDIRPPTIGGFSIDNVRVITVGDIDPYTGAYTVTPSSSAQVLQTNGLRMTDNVTVNPIPSNYGLITYNGFEITVS